MREDPGGDDAVVTAEDATDVLDRFAGVEADLLTARVHGMSSQLHHGHFHAVPGAVGRLLEDESRTEGQTGGRRQGSTERGRFALRQFQHRRQFVDAQVGDVQQAANAHEVTPVPSARTASSTDTISSISAMDTVNGGASRNELAFTALVTTPRFNIST